MNTFAKIIERMEDLVLAGLNIPLTPWTIVHGDKLVPLLDRIRESLPEEIRQAQRVVEHRDDMLGESQRKAAQILQEAKDQAEFMLSESELLRAVHVEAERIRQQVWSEMEALKRTTHEEIEILKTHTYEEARNVKEGADHYAETILSSLDKSLAEFHTVVRNGQKHLKRAKSEALHQASFPSGTSPKVKAQIHHSPRVPQESFSPSSGSMTIKAQELLQATKTAV